MSIPVVKPEKIERIEHPDGRVDVVVHVSKLKVDAAMREARRRRAAMEQQAEQVAEEAEAEEEDGKRGIP